MWFSRFPGATKSVGLANSTVTGGANASVRSPAGFYANLLELRRWWDAELAAEGMMELPSVPSPASTNGTWLKTQAVHSIVRSMITRDKKWHPRYGTTPGFGMDFNDGLQDVFTATVTAALEYGAMPCVKPSSAPPFCSLRVEGLAGRACVCVCGGGREELVISIDSVCDVGQNNHDLDRPRCSGRNVETLPLCAH